MLCPLFGRGCFEKIFIGKFSRSILDHFQANWEDFTGGGHLGDDDFSKIVGKAVIILLEESTSNWRLLVLVENG